MFRLGSVAQGAMLLLAFPTLVPAQGKSRAAKVPASTAAPSPRGTPAVRVFRDSDPRVFREYSRTHGLRVTPLPPGIAKNLARGKPLPPGIAKQALPRTIIAIRPGAGRDVSFLMVGRHAVALRNGVVVDMMTNVFP